MKTIWIVIIFISIVTVWLLSGIFIDHFYLSSYRGIFGDKFGFINSLFSGLALGGIIISIRLQRTELALQRKELIQTREEFKDQNFQTTFFNLQRNQRQIVDEINIQIPIYTKDFKERYHFATGRKFFIECKKELRKLIQALESESFNNFDIEIIDLVLQQVDPEMSDYERIELEIHASSTRSHTLSKYKITKEEYHSYRDLDIEQKLKFIYGKFFNKYSYAIGHYFRHIYHILLFLDKSEKEKLNGLKLEKHDSKEIKIQEIKDEFYGYAQFLKAQMDTPELFTLFYNSFQFPKAKALLIKYKMLDTLHVSDLLRSEHNIVTEFLLIN